MKEKIVSDLRVHIYITEANEKTSSVYSDNSKIGLRASLPSGRINGEDDINMVLSLQLTFTFNHHILRQISSGNYFVAVGHQSASHLKY